MPTLSSAIDIVTNSPAIFAHHRAELELLVLCCRTQMSSAQIARALQLLQSSPGFDWTYLLELARRHSVLPLLCQQLQTHCGQALPKAIRIELERLFKTNAYKNIKFSRELGQLLKVFRAHNIPVLAFKGPTLGEIAYGDYTLRQFTDLDLLVHETDMLQAKKLLVEQGYKSLFKLNVAQQLSYLHLGSEQDFWQQAKQIMVDLHWSILPKGFSFSPQSAYLWARCQTLELDNQPVQTLALEDLLLFLCVHGAKHNWESLGLICDIAELLRSQPHLDWQYMQRNVGKIGNATMLRFGLWLAHTILNAYLPPQVLAYVEADPPTPSLIEAAYRYMFSALVSENSLSYQATTQTKQGRIYQIWQSYKNRLTTWFARDQVYLGCMERWQDRLLFWSDIVIPTPLELETFPLPTQLFFLYYPLRPLRLAAKYLSGKYRDSRLD